MQHICILLSLLVLTACESVGEFSSESQDGLTPTALLDFDVVNNPIIGRDYTLIIKDNPQAARFDLTLRSRTNRSLCLSYGDWPYSGKDHPAGSLNFQSEYVYVEAGGKKFPIETTNFGYRIYPKDKPLGQSHIIKPNEELSGAIPYSRFKGGFDLTLHQSRFLVFSSFPVYCWQYFGEPLANMTPTYKTPSDNSPELRSVTHPPIEGEDYLLSVKDNKIEARFEIELESMTDDFLCIADDSWPIFRGKKDGNATMRFGSRYPKTSKTYLWSEGEIFDVKSTVFKSCNELKDISYGCSMIIDPRKKIYSNIPYSEFITGSEIEAIRDRKLIFDPQPLFCWQAFDEFMSN